MRLTGQVPLYWNGTTIETSYRGRDIRVQPGFGRDDAVDLFRVPGTDQFYAIAINTGLPYVGAVTFDSTGEVQAEVFFQEWQVEDALGRDWEDKTPMTLVKRLAEWLY